MGTAIVIVILAVAVGTVIRVIVKNKKSGKSMHCGGDCKHCSGGCH